MKAYAAICILPSGNMPVERGVLVEGGRYLQFEDVSVDPDTLEEKSSTILIPSSLCILTK